LVLRTNSQFYHKLVVTTPALGQLLISHSVHHQLGSLIDCFHFHIDMQWQGMSRKRKGEKPSPSKQAFAFADIVDCRPGRTSDLRVWRFESLQARHQFHALPRSTLSLFPICVSPGRPV
jgi:hypothetical protein